MLHACRRNTPTPSAHRCAQPCGCSVPPGGLPPGPPLPVSPCHWLPAVLQGTLPAARLVQTSSPSGLQLRLPPGGDPGLGEGTLPASPPSGPLPRAGTMVFYSRPLPKLTILYSALLCLSHRMAPGWTEGAAGREGSQMKHEAHTHRGTAICPSTLGSNLFILQFVFTSQIRFIHNDMHETLQPRVGVYIFKPYLKKRNLNQQGGVPRGHSSCATAGPRLAAREARLGSPAGLSGSPLRWDLGIGHF